MSVDVQAAGARIALCGVSRPFAVTWFASTVLSSSVTLAHSAQLSGTPLSSHCRCQLSPAVRGCCAADWEAGVGNAHDKQGLQPDRVNDTGPVNM